MWERSYSNIMMLAASIPRFDDQKKEEVKEMDDLAGIEDFLKA